MPFKASGFFADPFAITTISFGLITWIIAIAGAASSPQDDFPTFTWWGLVYQIILLLVILLLYFYNTIELYKFTLVGLIAIAFVYSSNSTNSLIYSNNSAYLCCGAGCMLLSMLNLTLIIYFGGHPESPTNQFIDSFSLRSSHPSHNHLQDSNTKFNHNLEDDEEYKRYVSPVDLPNNQDSVSNRFQDNNLRQSQLTTNNKSSNTPYMSSSQLNGLENFSSSDINNRDLTNNKRSTVYNTDQNDSEPIINFRYKAKALYSYDANPDDINEISFVKDETLEVDDIDGKWWQARRSNGQIGICPSNYVKLLD